MGRAIEAIAGLDQLLGDRAADASSAPASRIARADPIAVDGDVAAAPSGGSGETRARVGSIAGARGRCRATAPCSSVEDPLASSSSQPSSQKPAGESAQTECARPRRASSSAIQPPIELPARWARSMPSSSSWRSASSMSRDRRRAAGRPRPAAWPSAVGTITSKSSARSGTTWRQTRSLQRIPWKRTSGSPEPSRRRPQAGSRHISRIGGPPRPGMSKTPVSAKPLRS